MPLENNLCIKEEDVERIHVLGKRLKRGYMSDKDRKIIGGTLEFIANSTMMCTKDIEGEENV